jgi:hypothetical protein
MHDPDEAPLPVDALNYLAILAQGTSEVLASNNLPVRPIVEEDARPPLREDDIVAIVTFSGQAAGGTLVLASSPSVLRRSLPYEPDASVPVEVLLDWCGELANQVLGRVKDRLVRHGATIYVGTPRAFICADAPFGLLDPVRTVGQVLVGADAHVFAWFEVHADAHFRLEGDPQVDVPSPRNHQIF